MCLLQVEARLTLQDDVNLVFAPKSILFEPFSSPFRAELGAPALAFCLRTASSTCDTAAVVKVQPSNAFSCSCGRSEPRFGPDFHGFSSMFIDFPPKSVDFHRVSLQFGAETGRRSTRNARSPAVQKCGTSSKPSFSSCSSAFSRWQSKGKPSRQKSFKKNIEISLENA